MKIRLIMLLALCLVSACSARNDGNAAKAQAARQQVVADRQAEARKAKALSAFLNPPMAKAGTWYQAGEFRVRSQMPGIAIAPMTDLPVVALAKADDHCPRVSEPKSTEGKWALARGWWIGEENALGPLTIVNVLRRWEYEIDGDCAPIDGRFLVFAKGKPIAIIFETVADTYPLGTLEMTKPGVLRVGSDFHVAPFGDLFVKGHDIDIGPLPPSEKACKDTQPIPNVYGKPIERARTTLRRAGWKPAPVHYSREDLDMNPLAYLYRDGITEVTYCEPHTQCTFGYRSGRATLSVFTMNDVVTDYTLDCTGREVKVGVPEWR